MYVHVSFLQDLEGTYGKDPSWVDPDDTAPKKKPRPSKAKKVSTLTKKKQT